jgi:hypothetical protein
MQASCSGNQAVAAGRPADTCSPACCSDIRGRGSSHGTTTVHGVIGSEKAAFFADPVVQKALAHDGLKVEVDQAGSRQIATSIDLDEYDFAFPSLLPSRSPPYRPSGRRP